MNNKKDYRERYKKLGESEWFKKHYEGKSLGDCTNCGMCSEDVVDGGFSCSKYRYYGRKPEDIASMVVGECDSWCPGEPGEKITDEALANVFSAFAKKLEDNQQDIPSELQKLVNDNFWDLLNDDCTPVTTHEPTCSIIDHSPRYTKTEIENRLYQLIDNETIFPPGEDMGPAYKLLNKFLDSLE